MMHRNVWIPATVLALALLTTAVMLPGPATEAGPAQSVAVAALGDNHQPDGRYVLKTNDPRSIQRYYQHVGMPNLMLADAEEQADMRETCLTLGAAWRPLGHVKLPDGRGQGAYPLHLCYFTGANPPEVARAKCANLGRELVDNRGEAREVVCGPALARRESN